jgi:hypothetical protein
MKMFSGRIFWVLSSAVLLALLFLVQVLPGWRQLYGLSSKAVIFDPPGAIFEPLQHRLEGLSEAGYIDLAGSQGGMDARFWSLYQQAQLVFAPTRLEIVKPLTQENIVLISFSENSLESFLNRYGFHVVGISEGVAVLKQGGNL